MLDDYQRIEIITGTARRRRWMTEEKFRILFAPPAGDGADIIYTFKR